MNGMRNIVVVGGTKGIGRHIAGLLNDCNVYVVARSPAELPLEDSSTFIEGDIMQPSIDLSVLPEIIDGLVYCPGTINLKPFHRLTEEDFLRDWQINFMGAVRIIQALLPKLKKSPNASIVLFSTVAATTGMPFHASIAAAKGSLEGLTVSLAAEFAPGIRVNCLALSLTATPLADRLVNTPEKLEAMGKRHPLQRVGQPGEIAEMTIFLLSEKTGWITGQIIHVDGGMSTLKV